VSEPTAPPTPPAGPQGARPHASRTVRWVLWSVGTLSLVLGLIGVVLPGLPTTPFILLSAACYARASPRLYHWLTHHRFMGPMVRDWETHRNLTRRTKTVAQVSMVLMVGLSAWGLRDRPVLLAVVLVAAAVGVWVVARIPTRPG
jgi:uncharacterized membrane protein YbaN (DUF454 family)